MVALVHGRAEGDAGTAHGRAHRHPGHVLDPAGHDQLVLAGHDPLGGELHRLLEDPDCRSIVVAGTSSGSPAASQALRATFTDCSPIWETQPMITSSTSIGSIPLRSTSARSTTAPRSTACTPANPPFRRPTGVRTAPTTTGSSPAASDSAAAPHNAHDRR